MKDGVLMGTDTTDTGTIHVLIATKNSERFLEQCLHSVMDQKRLPDRVTVIDHGSSDRTWEIIHNFPFIDLQLQEGVGIPNAWNQGIRSGSSEFVAFIDSDDYWVPDFLGDCLEALRNDPTAQYAVAQAKFILSGNYLPHGFRPELVNAERIGWMPGTTVFRRIVFAEVGLFPEDFRIASDIEWYARLRNVNVPMVRIPKVGLFKRMHGDNASLDSEIAQVYRQEILRVARNNIKSSSAAHVEGDHQI